eukprot:m.87692 g.87692  ORF g.87692 m.87692 type:complete len:50 (-) comp14790_c0_seq6:2571-2720(-)
MHGRVKVRTTEEQRQAKELERQKKCKGFLKLRNALFHKVLVTTALETAG